MPKILTSHFDLETRQIAQEEREMTPEEIAEHEAAQAELQPLVEDAAAREAAHAALIALTARQVLRSDTIADEAKKTVGGMFPRWKMGEAVAVDDIRRHGEGLYECIQAHTTQTDWEPQLVPALWRKIVGPDVVAPWVQPQGAHDAYQIGAIVTHNGQTWICTSADNVWEPGVFGWNVHAA